MAQFGIELSPSMLAFVPLVAFLVQLIKETGLVENVKGLLPLVAIGLGIACSFLAAKGLTTWYDPVLPGVMIGILATGGYEAFKNSRKKI